MKLVSILGSGNIGSDLLVKCLHTNGIELVAIGGRHAGSKGLVFAASKGVATTDGSIEGLLKEFDRPDILIDCTSAAHHRHNYGLCKQLGITVIDMTPSNLGISCCPVVNLDKCLGSDNINMISCGGQASMPVCYAFKQANPEISYIEVVSTISSASAGPGTRKNISQYITSTKHAISRILGIKTVKVIINITPAIPPVNMQTTILAHTAEIQSVDITELLIDELITQTRKYVPGYSATLSLKQLGRKTMCQVMVSGTGHYLPKYAGNLDIINCAALEVIGRL